MSLNAIKQAIKSAGYAKYVADISEDPEIYEVQLREPWINKYDERFGLRQAPPRRRSSSELLGGQVLDDAIIRIRVSAWINHVSTCDNSLTHDSSDVGRYGPLPKVQNRTARFAR